MSADEFESLEKRLHNVPRERASTALYDRLQQKAAWRPAPWPWATLLPATLIFLGMLFVLLLPEQAAERPKHPAPIREPLVAPDSVPPLPIAGIAPPANGLRLSQVVSPLHRALWSNQADFSEPFSGITAEDRLTLTQES